MKNSDATDFQLQAKSLEYRREILRIIYQAGAGHTGGSLSCVDILNVLYNRVMNVGPDNFDHPSHDRYVQSKGHSVEALYVVLADQGFFPPAELDSLCRGGSPFVGHPTRKVPGIEMNTGALGHGLPISVGMALAGKLDDAPYRVFTLLGDGELAEGSNWEAAMCAAHYKLDNLTAIVDCNTLQITGYTRDVCNNEPLDQKFASFGWNVIESDGHCLRSLTDALCSRSPNQPTCVIANTTKGRGISFMEHVASWHHGVPSEQEYETAMAELENQLLELRGIAS